MPRVTQQYLDDRRDQILAAARRCFLRDGFHATSMQDIFGEADLSAGAVYRYFASKDELIIAIAEENVRDVVAMLNRLATQPPGRSVGAAVADVFELVQAKNQQEGLGGIAVLVWAEALRNPTLAAQFGELLDQIRGAMAEVVTAHQRAGDLPADVPADALAAVFLSIVPGFILQVALFGTPAVDGIPAAVRALWPRSGEH